MTGRIIALPRWLGVLLIVCCSVSLSVAGTYLGIDRSEMTQSNWRTTWLLSMGIPVLVSAPVGYLTFTLLHELDKARAEALHMANTDILTGALSRRRFIQIAEEVLTAESGSPSTASLLLLDVDNFKQVNDEHGHNTGDAVLQMVAQRCTEALRSGDSFARWGGEEFIAILPDTDAKESVKVALRLRDAVSSSSVTKQHGGIQVTVSIGVAPRLGTFEPLSAMLTRADLALYKAKRDGKNAAVLMPFSYPEREFRPPIGIGPRAANSEAAEPFRREESHSTLES